MKVEFDEKREVLVVDLKNGKEAKEYQFEMVALILCGMGAHITGVVDYTKSFDCNSLVVQRETIWYFSEENGSMKRIYPVHVVKYSRFMMKRIKSELMNEVVRELLNYEERGGWI